MSTVSSRRVPSGWRLLLHGVDWRTYTRLLRIFAERPAIRLTYDRGVLEIMSPLYEHESDGHLLGRFEVVLTEELHLPIASGGSTTLRRRLKRRGLEPDECFWIQNESRIRGKRRLDLRIDPPPDLGIEIDVPRSSPDRMAIYAALNVSEVWRYDGQTLTFHVLGANGRYSESTHSRAFPLVRPADLAHFLPLRATLDENAVVAQFRAWVRQQLSGGVPPTAVP